MSKGIELAKKLLALKNSSNHESERLKAEKLLTNILQKYGLTMSDIESEQVRAIMFTINPIFEKLFFQCIVNTVGVKVKYGKRGNKIWFDCSEANAVEIKEKYKFYISLYKKELESFQAAFIHKHKIYPIDGGGDSKGLTTEEAIKLSNLMKGMEDASFAKALNK